MPDVTIFIDAKFLMELSLLLFFFSAILLFLVASTVSDLIKRKSCNHPDGFVPISQEKHSILEKQRGRRLPFPARECKKCGKIKGDNNQSNFSSPHIRITGGYRGPPDDGRPMIPPSGGSSVKKPEN